MDIETLLSLPKSIYVSLRLFPFWEAIKLPIMVRYNTSILSLDGLIKVKSGGVKRGMIRVGFGTVGIFDKKYERSILQINGNLIINGDNVILGAGSKICVFKNAKLIIGNNFENTANVTIVCTREISIGCNFLASWKTCIMDNDFHSVENLVDGLHSNMEDTVYIGDNVWMGMGATLLKGSQIPNGCIIGAGALVNKKFREDNCLIAGSPATIKKRNVTLKRENQ